MIKYFSSLFFKRFKNVTLLQRSIDLVCKEIIEAFRWNKLLGVFYCLATRKRFCWSVSIFAEIDILFIFRLICCKEANDETHGIKVGNKNTIFTQVMIFG